MTWALCFSCGNVKFGAIVPCDECGVASTGDMNLDINFSDHYLARSTLEQFGEVVKVINAASDNRKLCFYSFIYYVSENYSILESTPPPAEVEQIKSLLARVTLPHVEIKPGLRGDVTSRSESHEETTNKRKWWQFWKRGP